jgi:hypothetical protein
MQSFFCHFLVIEFFNSHRAITLISNPIAPTNNFDGNVSH